MAWLDRLEACPASGVFSGPASKMHPSAWWGIFVHRFLEHCYTRGRDGALAYLAQKGRRELSLCRRIPVHTLPANGKPEVQWAWRPRERIERRYSYPEQANARAEVMGRADLLFDDCGTPHVADYKTGEGGQTPEGNAQLLGLALAARSEAGSSEAVGSIVQVPKTGHLIWRTVRYSGQELDDHAERVERVHARVVADRDAFREAGVVPAFSAGGHCEWCDIKPVCPAHGGDPRL